MLDTAVGPDPPENPTASFWASGLASPWQTFGEIAYILVTALESKDQGTIQVAINTYLGECYRLTGGAPRWQQVKAQMKDYVAGDPPEGVQMITAGVDVQKRSLYYTIRGYGYKQESWLLEQGQLRFVAFSPQPYGIGLPCRTGLTPGRQVREQHTAGLIRQFL